MKIVNDKAQETLVDLVGSLRGSPEGYYALHFNFSQLLEQYRSDYQIKIAVNILHDLYKGQDGIVFVLTNKDVIVLYHGGDRGLLEKSIFQLRYLFMDDSLSYTEDGFENPDFCAVYDLEFQWRDFFRSCKVLMGSPNTEMIKVAEPQPAPKVEKPAPAKKEESAAIQAQASEPLIRFTPDGLDHVLHKLQKTDISRTIESQAICAFPRHKTTPVSLYKETFVHIAKLRELLNIHTDLLSNKSLFKYLTHMLDKKVLDYFKEKTLLLDNPLCLNINVTSLTSEAFVSLDKLIPQKNKKSVILEIHISDVFEDLQRYLVVQDEIKKMGYQLCLDGLDDVSILYVNPKALGFNLIKLQWNPEMTTKAANSEHLSDVADAVKAFGANRLILCRCDNQSAIDYGHSLGISLFQGWHVDKQLAK